MAENAAEGYVEHILEHFGSPLDGLRIAVDCANGAFSAIAPGVFERLGAQVTTVAAAPDGTNINVGCGATDLGLLQEVVRTGDVRPRRRVRRRRRPDARRRRDGSGAGRRSDPGRARARARRRHGRGDDDDQPRLPPPDGRARNPRAHDRRRRPARARRDAGRRSRARRRAVRPRHLARRSRDGRRAGRRPAPLPGTRRRLAGGGGGRAEEASRRPSRTSRWHEPGLSPAVVREVERLGDELAGRGRILVRPSGTEPVVRVLVEAESEEEAANLCGRVALLVRSEADH